jgi:hypothetical protein
MHAGVIPVRGMKIALQRLLALVTEVTAQGILVG